ncbi:MAG TPA: disulfide bond formation protein B [Allosphingosinicella sp.]|jgi:disulfide bond formation protein DsbB|nr:disulfide bond formation protein B [Allosphingosinicella sp.]
MASPLRLAKALAFLVPAALLGGAYASQIWGGLVPCEMCWWQRYPHMAALAFALLALLAGRLPDRGRSFVWLAALAIAVSGGLGVYHAGVELDLWEGFTQCTQTVTGESAADLLTKMTEPSRMVRCDEAQWKDSLLHISLAGWNAILSLVSALVILWLSLKRPRNPA